MLWGAGVPKRFGGGVGTDGVFAYRIDAAQQGAAADGAKVTAQDIDALYQEWAGTDGHLSAAEWDSAVDRRFGEQSVDLELSRWDDDADGTISRAEFEEAIRSSGLLDGPAGD